MSSGFNLTNKYDSIKYLTMDKQERKNPHRKQNLLDKPPRISISEQEGKIAQQFMKKMLKNYFGLLKIQVKFLIN